MSSEFDIYKLTYSGKCEQLHSDDIISNFTLFDILTLYISNLKRLYIWIGKRASQNLKNFIPQVRDILLKENPNLMILRNYTIESGSEPENFLEMIGISEEDLSQRIKNLEVQILPSLSEINKLKEKADKFFVSEDYKRALEVSEKIKYLAVQIEDKSLEQDQVNFLEEINSRLKIVESLHTIEDETRKKITLFDYLTSIENYREAHNLVEHYISNYGKKFPLKSISIAQQLISKDEELVKSLKLKQVALKKEFEKIEKDFQQPSHDLSSLLQLLNKAKDYKKKILDEDFGNRWDNLKHLYEKFKQEKIQKINYLSNSAINFLDDDKNEAALEVFEEILSDLKRFI